MQMKKNLAVYTRIPDKYYDKALANSVHFAYKSEKGIFEPLNNNYGVLFAEAVLNENNTINPKSLKDPFIIKLKDDSFGIIATRTNEHGEAEGEIKNKVLLWTTSDFINFSYQGLVRTEEYEIKKSEESDLHFFSDKIKIGNAISIDLQILEEAVKYWVPVHHIETQVPETITISTIDEIKSLKATAVYSDGSTAEKNIEWELNNINFSKPGKYKIEGKVKTQGFPFPLAKGYADPVILPWNGKYYFIATNDNVNDIGLFVRESETIEGLFAEDFKEVLILDVDEEKNFIQTFWAPEFHKIGDDLYIFFAVGGKQWSPQCHTMKLKKGGNIMDPNHWETPIRFKKKDGSFLTTDGISLDMSYFKAMDKSFVVWSYRYGIGNPHDTGSMIYIGEIDESDPTILISDPVLLTRPLLGWENLRGTINNEGPYPLITNNKVYIPYAAADARGYLYSIGVMSAQLDSDLLDINCWTKSPTPYVNFLSFNDRFGCGHHSFFTDYDGNTWIMYHAVEEPDKRIACSAMNRVHFRKDGSPVFNMSYERDLNPQLSLVSIMCMIN